MNLSDYSDFTRVVIIDDVESEGIGIQKALQLNNISSAMYIVDDISPTANCLPSTPLRNIGLVFLDLEYQAVTGGDNAHAAMAIENLKRMVGDRNNYVLIIWSAHTTHNIKEKFMDYFNNPKVFNKPFIEPILLDKAAFISSGDINALSTELLGKFTALPASSVLLESERISMNAASTTVDNIVKNKTEEELVKLINSLSGSYGSVSDPSDKKIQNALMVISSLFYDSIESELLQHDFSGLSIENNDLLNEEEKSQINYQLMFSNEVTRNGSGAIYKNTSEEEPVKNTFMNKTKAELDDLEANFYDGRLICIDLDLTPLCDSAQGRDSCYLVTGLLFPIKIVGTGANVKLNKNSSETELHVFDKKFFYEGRIYQLVVDKRTYRSVLSVEITESPILKVRGGILVDLQQMIATHISRSGHVLL